MNNKHNKIYNKNKLMESWQSLRLRKVENYQIYNKNDLNKSF